MGFGYCLYSEFLSHFLNSGATTHAHVHSLLAFSKSTPMFIFLAVYEFISWGQWLLPFSVWVSQGQEIRENLSNGRNKI